MAVRWLLGLVVAGCWCYRSPGLTPRPGSSGVADNSTVLNPPFSVEIHTKDKTLVSQFFFLKSMEN